MTQIEIQKIIAQHALWLENPNEGERANLTGTNLSGTNLSGADLSEANLSGADLSMANLLGANFSRANLFVADLSMANLSWANLSWTNLSRADLSWANLSRANLSRANLSRADLSRANLSGAALPKFQKCSNRKKNYIGWKKVREGNILKLEIQVSHPSTSNLVGNKCRAQKVKVLQGSGISSYNPSFIYTEGEFIEEPNYNSDIRIVYAPGIHFFLTKKEAEAYSL